MELTITRKAFLRALARTAPVADRKSSMPILSNILLRTDGPKTLRLAATDLYLSMSCAAEAEIRRPGTVSLCARTLFDIVKNLPDSDVSLDVGDNCAAELRCGKVRFKVPGMPGQNFPALPQPGDSAFFELDAERLFRLTALTYYSMSTDETRPHLAGALLEGVEGTVRMVTTDGHRLSKAEYQHTEDPEEAHLSFVMLVPNKGVTELRRLLDEVRGEDGALIEVNQTKGSAFFRHGETLMSVKLAEDAFPPYSKVIPDKHSRRVVVGRHMLIDAIKRISLVANDKSGAVRFTLQPGTLRLTGENPELGEGAEEIDVDFAGTKVEIGFAGRYALDPLHAITEDEVALELGGPLDPGVIRPVGPTDFIGVIMPMRI